MLKEDIKILGALILCMVSIAVGIIDDNAMVVMFSIFGFIIIVLIILETKNYKIFRIILFN